MESDDDWSMGLAESAAVETAKPFHVSGARWQQVQRRASIPAQHKSD
jgi:hypothetical protein